MFREFICNGCNKKCIISFYDSNYNTVQGNKCNLGIDYAKNYLLNTNKDIFTTLVRIKGSKYNVLPVKSSEPIEKSLWIECSKALSRLYVGYPIEIGDVICKNVLNTGVDIIAIKNITE